MYGTVIYVGDRVAGKRVKTGIFNINNSAIIVYVCGKVKFDPSRTPSTKINFRLVKDLNMKCKTLKLLEEHIE